MALFGRKKTEEKKEEGNTGVVSDKKVKTDKTSQVKNTEPKKSEPQDAKKQSSSMKDLYSEGKSDETKSSKKSKNKRKYGNAFRVLVKPLITEKAASLGAENKYVFAVAKDANKIEVTNAVEEVYGIKPVAVNIINMKGKKVRQGRTMGRRKDWKKAIVALPKGKVINIYEGV